MQQIPSTSEEESTGTREVTRASCDPVEVELTIDASLGSEYPDGSLLKVEGRLPLPWLTARHQVPDVSPLL